VKPATKGERRMKNKTIETKNFKIVVDRDEETILFTRKADGEHSYGLISDVVCILRDEPIETEPPDWEEDYGG